MGGRRGLPGRRAKVVGHEAAGVIRLAGLVASPPERSQEEFAAFVRAENELAVAGAA